MWSLVIGLGSVSKGAFSASLVSISEKVLGFVLLDRLSVTDKGMDAGACCEGDRGGKEHSDAC